MNVMIFGTRKSKDSQKALRFFKERGITPQFVDLGQKKTRAGELKAFRQRFSLSELINDKAPAYDKQGLAYLKLSDEALIDMALAEPSLLQLPLIRSGKTLTVGWDEQRWRELYQAAKKA